jgi:hypothetical protein
MHMKNVPLPESYKSGVERAAEVHAFRVKQGKIAAAAARAAVVGGTIKTTPA